MDDLTLGLADRLKTLRQTQGWSMDQLAEKTDISRATLSRMEAGQVSPTAAVLGKLCAAYGLSMSRLMQMVEDRFTPHIPHAEQATWQDPGSGFQRRAVSPPAPGLSAEVIEGALPSGARLRYDQPFKPGQEHHLIVLSGALTLRLGDDRFELQTGDCLRYRLTGTSDFETNGPADARYLLVLI
ncbi:MAG: helix-turn-helix domain-containing protein [Sedimentitalea sp.]